MGTATADKVEDMAEAAERALLLERIKHSLQKDLQRVLDLFRKWDTDGDGTVDRDEFGRAVALLGFKPPDGPSWGPACVAYTSTIDALFASLDADGSGTAEINEIEAALKGGRKQNRKPRDPRLGPRDFVSPVTGQVIRAGVPCRPVAQDARNPILARNRTHACSRRWP